MSDRKILFVPKEVKWYSIRRKSDGSFLHKWNGFQAVFKPHPRLQVKGSCTASLNMMARSKWADLLPDLELVLIGCVVKEVVAANISVGESTVQEVQYRPVKQQYEKVAVTRTVKKAKLF